MGKRTKTGTTDDSSHSKGSEISHTTNRRSSQNHQKLKSPTENRENTKMVENEHNESETVFGENQKASIPRQARPIIQRVESEKCGYGTSSSPMMMSPPAASSSSSNSANSGSAMMMAPWPIGPSTP